jgi:hypothetical protein
VATASIADIAQQAASVAAGQVTPYKILGFRWSLQLSTARLSVLKDETGRSLSALRPLLPSKLVFKPCGAAQRQRGPTWAEGRRGSQRASRRRSSEGSQRGQLPLSASRRRGRCNSGTCIGGYAITRSCWFWDSGCPVLIPRNATRSSDDNSCRRPSQVARHLLQAMQPIRRSPDASISSSGHLQS